MQTRTGTRTTPASLALWLVVLLAATDADLLLARWATGEPGAPAAAVHLPGEIHVITDDDERGHRS